MAGHILKPMRLEGISRLFKQALADTFSAKTHLHPQDLNQMLAGTLISPIQTDKHVLLRISENLPKRAQDAKFSGDIKLFSDQLRVFAEDIKTNVKSHRFDSTVQTGILTQLVAAKPVLDQYILHVARTGPKGLITGTNLLEEIQLSKALSLIAASKAIPRDRKDSDQIITLYNMSPDNHFPYSDSCKWFEDGLNLIEDVKSVSWDVLSYIDRVAPKPASYSHH